MQACVPQTLCKAYSSDQCMGNCYLNIWVKYFAIWFYKLLLCGWLECIAAKGKDNYHLVYRMAACTCCTTLNWVNTHEDWAAYWSARNEVNNKLELAHSSYCRRMFDDSFSGNRRQFWKYIKAKRKDSTGISPLLVNGIYRRGYLKCA